MVSWDFFLTCLLENWAQALNNPNLDSCDQNEYYSFVLRTIRVRSTVIEYSITVTVIRVSRCQFFKFVFQDNYNLRKYYSEIIKGEKVKFREKY